MIAAVDTNILLDIFLPNEEFASGSAELRTQAYDEGALVICDIVYAELALQFDGRQQLTHTLPTISMVVISGS